MLTSSLAFWLGFAAGALLCALAVIATAWIVYQVSIRHPGIILKREA